MSEAIKKPTRPRQAGAVEMVLRQLEARRAAEGEGAAEPAPQSIEPAIPAEPKRPIFYPKKGPGSVPPEACRPWSMADRAETEFEHLDDLAASLSKEGQLQPVIVRTVQDAAHPEIRYEVIAGQARWRAATKAGTMLDVVVHPELSDEAAFRAMVGENEFRRGLSDFSRAKRFAAALERGLYRSKGEMAEKLRLSPAQLSYFLGFADLPARVVARFRNIGAVPVRTGYVIAQLARDGDVEQLLADLPRIESGEIGRAELEARLRGEGASKGVSAEPASTEKGAKSSQAVPVMVNASSGAPLFVYAASNRKGTTVQIPPAVASRLDEAFWAELKGLLERRLA